MCFVCPHKIWGMFLKFYYIQVLIHLKLALRDSHWWIAESRTPQSWFWVFIEAMMCLSIAKNDISSRFVIQFLKRKKSFPRVILVEIASNILTLHVILISIKHEIFRSKIHVYGWEFFLHSTHADRQEALYAFTQIPWNRHTPFQMNCFDSALCMELLLLSQNLTQAEREYCLTALVTICAGMW